MSAPDTDEAANTELEAIWEGEEAPQQIKEKAAQTTWEKTLQQTQAQAQGAKNATLQKWACGFYADGNSGRITPSGIPLMMAAQRELAKRNASLEQDDNTDHLRTTNHYNSNSAQS